jgi:hypothetical protein
MAETVNVPGAGKINRTWVMAGAAAVAGIVIFAYWRRASQPAAAPGEGDYTAGDQWSPDAFTGATAPPGGETYDPNDVTGGFTAPTTNAEWSQRVIDALANMGFDLTYAASTIGKYLSGNPLNAAEKLLVQSGLAVMGNPPAGALPIISAPEPTATPPATQVGPAAPRLAARFEKTPYKHWHLSWNRPSGALGFGVYRRNHSTGKYEALTFTTGTGVWVRNADDWYSVKARTATKYGLSSNPVHTTRK